MSQGAGIVRNAARRENLAAFARKATKSRSGALKVNRTGNVACGSAWKIELPPAFKPKHPHL
jgi:hypothetical protein